jgi:hypothetical protein
MTPLFPVTGYVFVGLFGLLIGSFLNVVVHRVPRPGINHSAFFPLPTVWACAPRLGEYSGAELAIAARSLSRLW